MTTIVATSDLHGVLPDIPECDLLIIGGDVCPDAPGGHDRYYMHDDKGAQLQRDWLWYEFRPWLKSIKAKRKVGIAGNHDFVFEDKHTRDVAYDLPWVYLENSGYEFEGLRIYGTPQVPGLPRWAFYASPPALEARASAIPEDLDILISHGPPHHMCDKIPEHTIFNPTNDPIFVGDYALAAAILEKRPRVTFCGHIHEGYGSCFVNGIEVQNVSHMTNDYEPENPPKRFEMVPRD